MGANKITYYGKVLIDLTSDTVTPETLAEGITAHDKSGAQITGAMPVPTLETWLFEMEDGTTVEKVVSVSA